MVGSWHFHLRNPFLNIVAFTLLWVQNLNVMSSYSQSSSQADPLGYTWVVCDDEDGKLKITITMYNVGNLKSLFSENLK